MISSDPFATLPLIEPEPYSGPPKPARPYGVKIIGGRLRPDADPDPCPPPPPKPPSKYGVEVINGTGRTQPADVVVKIEENVFTYRRDTASAVWTFPHGLKRMPGVHVYDEDGAWMLAEVYATETQVVVVHCMPQKGSVVLT